MKKAITQVQIIILFVIVLAILSLLIGSLGAKTQTVLEKLGLECADLPGMCPKSCFSEVNKEQFLKYVGYAAEYAWVEKKPCYFETTIKGETPTKYEVYQVMKDGQNLPFKIEMDDCLYGADIYTTDNEKNTDRIESDFTKHKAMVFWTTKDDMCGKGFFSISKGTATKTAGILLFVVGVPSTFVLTPYVGVPLAGLGYALTTTDANTLMIMPRDWYCTSSLPASNLYMYSMYKLNNKEICNDWMHSPYTREDYIVPLEEFKSEFSQCAKAYDDASGDEDVKSAVAMACGPNGPAKAFNLRIDDDISLEDLIKNELEMGTKSVKLASYDRSFAYPGPAQSFENKPLHTLTEKVVYVKFNGFPIDKDKDNKNDNLLLKKNVIYYVELFYYEDPSLGANDMIMEIGSLKCGLSQECQFNNVCNRRCAIPDPDCVTSTSSAAFKLSEYCKNKRVGDGCEYPDKSKGECILYDDLFASKVLLDKSKVYSPLFCSERNDGYCNENSVYPDIDCLEQACENKKEGDKCTFKQGGTEIESKCSY